MTYSVVVKVSVSFVWNRGSLPIISDFFRSTIVGRKRMSHFSSKRQKKGVVFTIMQNSQNSKNFCFSSFASNWCGMVWRHLYIILGHLLPLLTNHSLETFRCQSIWRTPGGEKYLPCFLAKQFTTPFLQLTCASDLFSVLCHAKMFLWKLLKE